MRDVVGAEESVVNMQYSEEDKKTIYEHAANNLYNACNKVVMNNPVLIEMYKTPCKNYVLRCLPVARPLFGLPERKKIISPAESPYSFLQFKNFIKKYTSSDDRNLTIGSFITQYTRTIINEDTKWNFPSLQHTTEEEFTQRFKERNQLNDSMIVGEILDAKVNYSTGEWDRSVPDPPSTNRWEKFKDKVKGIVK